MKSDMLTMMSVLWQTSKSKGSQQSAAASALPKTWNSERSQTQCIQYSLVKKLTAAQKAKRYLIRNPNVLNSTSKYLIRSHMNSANTLSKVLLSSYLSFYLLSNLFQSLPNIVYVLFTSPILATCSTHVTFFKLITILYFMKTAYPETHKIFSSLLLHPLF
jgi:hypothetical protein